MSPEGNRASEMDLSRGGVQRPPLGAGWPRPDCYDLVCVVTLGRELDWMWVGKYDWG